MGRPNSRDPRKDPVAALGKALARLRRQADFKTVEALAAVTGFSREAHTKTESGARTPSDDLYEATLTACKCGDAATVGESRAIIQEALQRCTSQ